MLAKAGGQRGDDKETSGAGTGSMPGPGELHQAEEREPENRVLRVEARWPAELRLRHRERGGFQQLWCVR